MVLFPAVVHDSLHNLLLNLVGHQFHDSCCPLHREPISYIGIIHVWWVDANAFGCCLSQARSLLRWFEFSLRVYLAHTRCVGSSWRLGKKSKFLEWVILVVVLSFLRLLISTVFSRVRIQVVLLLYLHSFGKVQWFDRWGLVYGWSNLEIGCWHHLAPPLFKVVKCIWRQPWLLQCWALYTLGKTWTRRAWSAFHRFNSSCSLEGEVHPTILLLRILLLQRLYLRTFTPVLEVRCLASTIINRGSFLLAIWYRRRHFV